MIRGGAQQLDDSAALDEELLVSGVPVGGFSSAGWSELHLELRVRECALPLDSSRRVRRGRPSLLFVFCLSVRGRPCPSHERATCSLDNTAVLREYSSFNASNLSSTRLVYHLLHPTQLQCTRLPFLRRLSPPGNTPRQKRRLARRQLAQPCRRRCISEFGGIAGTFTALLLHPTAVLTSHLRPTRPTRHQTRPPWCQRWFDRRPDTVQTRRRSVSGGSVCPESLRSSVHAVNAKRGYGAGRQGTNRRL